MTRQERNDLIMKCLSNRKNIDIDRAYELAVMAVDECWLGDSITLEECFLYTEYRLIVYRHRVLKMGDSA